MASIKHISSQLSFSTKEVHLKNAKHHFVWPSNPTPHTSNS